MSTRPFSLKYRRDERDDAVEEPLDVLVVGMGATGAGVALDAASRGMRVAVVDKGDVAAGTSSKSSKLIHGGLRYLENYEFGLVREGVVERQLLLELAPHLVRPMTFVYPVWPDTARRRLLGLGMATYDVFAGFRNVRRHDRVTAQEAVELAPALERSGLSYAYTYGDCATDDARLVLAVVQAARRFDALTLPYTNVVGLLKDHNDQVIGATCADRLTGETYQLRARHVVNATGVWVDTLLTAAEPARKPMVTPSKGVHIVVPSERLPLTESAVILPSKQGDGRSMFAIPWGHQTILGTTDTAYDGPLDAISMDAEDLDYILESGNLVFNRGLTAEDVVGAWAGVRPLLRPSEGGDGSMSDLSRKHTVVESTTGLLTITGGKLTTYRRMAQDVVDRIVERDGHKARCRTQEIPLGCARPLAEITADAVTAAHAVGLPEEVAKLMVRQHGESAPDVLSLAAVRPELEARLSPAADHILAEVVYAVRHEGASTLDDVMSRRTRISLRARDAGLPQAHAAAALMASELGMDDEWQRDQIKTYVAAVRTERGVAALDDLQALGA